MTTPSSGSIRFSDINNELLRPSTSQINLGSGYARSLSGNLTGPNNLSSSMNQDRTWLFRTADGQSGGYGNAVFDSDGNCYQLNYFSSSTGSYIVKLSAGGKKVWEIQLQKAVSVSNIYVDSNRYVYLMTYDNLDVYNGTLLKINSDGSSILWQRKFGYGTGTYPTNIVVDGSSNVYVALRGFNTGSSPVTCLMKLDSSGNISWQRQVYDSTGTSRSNIDPGITLDSGGNVYMSGSLIKTGTGAHEYNFIAKYNSSGTVQTIWQLGYQCTYTAMSNDLLYVLHSYYGGGSYTIYLSKINPSTNNWDYFKTIYSGASLPTRYLSTNGTYLYFIIGSTVYRANCSDATCSYARTVTGSYSSLNNVLGLSSTDLMVNASIIGSPYGNNWLKVQNDGSKTGTFTNDLGTNYSVSYAAGTNYTIGTSQASTAMVSWGGTVLEQAGTFTISTPTTITITSTAPTWTTVKTNI